MQRQNQSLTLCVGLAERISISVPDSILQTSMTKLLCGRTDVRLKDNYPQSLMCISKAVKLSD